VGWAVTWALHWFATSRGLGLELTLNPNWWLTHYISTHLALLAWSLSVAPSNLGSRCLSGLGSDVNSALIRHQSRLRNRIASRGTANCAWRGHAILLENGGWTNTRERKDPSLSLKVFARAPVLGLCFFVSVKRSTGHTHTPTENNTPYTDTHAHDKNNTPNPQTNTSHKHFTTLEGVYDIVWET